jgi:mono/diheme cytochrome c family protein
MQATDFFGDRRSERPIVEGTIARGHLRADEAFYTGKLGNTDVDTFPFPITKDVLERGRERFNIYCSPCHGLTGEGNGMVVQRGFSRPPTYHSDRLRGAPVGHFFDVITNGYGAMHSYASRVEPEDRWKIIAYIRVLQFSQDAKVSDVPPDKVQELNEAKQ